MWCYALVRARNRIRQPPLHGYGISDDRVLYRVAITTAALLSPAELVSVRNIGSGGLIWITTQIAAHPEYWG